MDHDNVRPLSGSHPVYGSKDHYYTTTLRCFECRESTAQWAMRKTDSPQSEDDYNMLCTECYERKQPLDDANIGRLDMREFLCFDCGHSRVVNFEAMLFSPQLLEPYTCRQCYGHPLRIIIGKFFVYRWEADAYSPWGYPTMGGDS